MALWGDRAIHRWGYPDTMGTIAVTLLLAGLYFAPTIVAWTRGRMTAPIFVVNLFLGWTLIAWVILLALAVSGQSHANRAA